MKKNKKEKKINKKMQVSALAETVCDSDAVFPRDASCSFVGIPTLRSERAGAKLEL